MGIAPLHAPVRRIAAAVAALAVSALAGCNNYDFFASFPTGTKLMNKSDKQLYRSFEFQLGMHGIGSRECSGTATVTFGDTECAVDVPARIRLSQILHSAQPTAQLEITYQPTGDVADRYRDLVIRARAGAAPNDPPLLLPDELTAPQRFVVTLRPNRRPRTLILSGGGCPTIELEERRK